MHYGARYYDPVIGRFVSADTIVPDMSNPQDLNRFSYVRNNPLRYTDPTGHKVDLGCETQGCDLPLDEELQAESNATQLIHDENFKRKAEFYARCAQGGGAECQTLHEAENILKGLGLALVAPTAGMGVAKGAEWLSWQLLKGCLYSSLCARLIGAGATGAAETARPEINITERGLAHVIKRHTQGGAEAVGRSIFTEGVEGIVNLIRQASVIDPTQQANGNLQRIVDAGRIVGIDRVTDLPTTIYTVITDIANTLVTAFPGVPGGR